MGLITTRLEEKSLTVISRSVLVTNFVRPVDALNFFTFIILSTKPTSRSDILRNLMTMRMNLGCDVDPLVSCNGAIGLMGAEI